MVTLLIEHRISDLDTWRRAFARFSQQRRDAGVLRERVMQPVDDPQYVLIDLEFASGEAARGFQQFLETHVWSTASRSPALVGTPQVRVAEVVDLRN